MNGIPFSFSDEPKPLAFSLVRWPFLWLRPGLRLSLRRFSRESSDRDRGVDWTEALSELYRLSDESPPVPYLALTLGDLVFSFNFSKDSYSYLAAPQVPCLVGLIGLSLLSPLCTSPILFGLPPLAEFLAPLLLAPFFLISSLRSGIVRNYSCLLAGDDSSSSSGVGALDPARDRPLRALLDGLGINKLFGLEAPTFPLMSVWSEERLSDLMLPNHSLPLSFSRLGDLPEIPADYLSVLALGLPSAFYAFPLRD